MVKSQTAVDSGQQPIALRLEYMAAGQLGTLINELRQHRHTQ